MGFSCINCKFFCTSIDILHNHFFTHRIDKTAVYQCQYIDCRIRYFNYKSFSQHVKRSHPNADANLNANVEIFCTGPSCNFSSHISNVLIKHISDFHINETSFTNCPFQNCPKTFNNKYTFRSHIFRFHDKTNTSPQVQARVQVDEHNIIESESIPNISSSSMSSEIELSSGSNLGSNPQTELANFLLKLKSRHNLTDNVIDLFVSELKNNDRTIVSDLKDKLKEIAILHDCIPIYNIFEKHIENKDDIYTSLSNSYKRDKYLKKHFPYLEPVEISLGKNSDGVSRKYHYIPILKNLELFFHDTRVQTQFLTPRAETKIGIYSDYTDGMIYKNNHFFSEGDRKLEIILYQDAFEVSNPIGSSKGKQKMVGVYMLLGNLFPYNRSRTDDIQLVLLCKDSDWTHFSPNKIFEVLIRDLIQLEVNGISLMLHNELKIVKGSVFAILGDNLGSNQIGGFAENFSKSLHWCRFCYFKNTDLETNVITPKLMRTVHNYDKELKILAKNVKKKFSNGVKGNSALNELTHYHVCNPGLPSCIAHDLPEGIISYDFHLLLNIYIKMGIFNHDYLNYAYASIRKKLKLNNLTFVNLTDTQTKLPGTATQNLYFLLLFPLIMKDFDINQDDDVWQMVIRLIEIARLSYSPQISDIQINYLSFLLDEYISFRKIVLVNVKCRPKHHFVMHYPKLIRLYGPLSKMSTLRFEAKHQPFKEAARKSKNRINITKLLAIRHQKLQVTIQENRFSPELICSISMPLTDDMFSFIIPPEFKFVSKEVTFRGVTYKENDFIIIDKHENFHIVLLQVQTIFINRNYDHVMFYGKSFKMIYNCQSCLYENKTPFKDIQFAFYDELITFISFRLLKKFERHYLSLPFAI